MVWENMNYFMRKILENFNKHLINSIYLLINFNILNNV